ncbi:undecaprenyldiphospho-muramoylpentapeptide beta-N-acetylglucosaminyltransferase [candidate division FCPU426 bacterium]|nr:undecaprenyldiphospho-muramoylpentapeptide beta-N-acetylglucosaminyltransferase [candidate division FCPU426 bacterium]
MTAATMSLGICGGGTGGHIFPALSVVSEIRRLQPEALIYYFGKAGGMEQDLAGRHGLPFYGLELAGITRSWSWQNTVSLWKAGAGFTRARAYLRDLKIQAVLGTGGYVCGPVVLAAASLGLPTIIHESNFVPGVTNRLLGRWVTTVCVTHAQTARYFSGHKVTVTGFPLRERLNEPTREEGSRIFGLDAAKRVLFVFTGSQSAHKVNRAVADLLPMLPKRMPDLQILWMTGEADFPLGQQACQKTSARVELRAFIHEVPEAYATSDMVLARAGAGTVAELSATGIPALLIPYPFAAGNHQAFNAEVMHKYGSAEVMTDKEMDGKTLLHHLEKAFKRLKYMQACGEVLRADYPKHAARDLAVKLLALAQRK